MAAPLSAALASPGRWGRPHPPLHSNHQQQARVSRGQDTRPALKLGRTGSCKQHKVAVTATRKVTCCRTFALGARHCSLCCQDGRRLLVQLADVLLAAVVLLVAHKHAAWARNGSEGSALVGPRQRGGNGRHGSQPDGSQPAPACSPSSCAPRRCMRSPKYLSRFCSLRSSSPTTCWARRVQGMRGVHR